MVRHQHVEVADPVALQDDVPEDRQEPATVDVVARDLLATVPAREDVVQHVGCLDPRSAHAIDGTDGARTESIVPASFGTPSF